MDAPVPSSGVVSDPKVMLASAAYVIAAAAGMAAIAQFVPASSATPLIIAWLGFVGVGGIGAHVVGAVREIRTSIGPANGSTLRELAERNHAVLQQHGDLLTRLAELEQYTHDANHKLVGRVGALTALVSQSAGIPLDEVRSKVDKAPPAPTGVARKRSTRKRAQ